MIIEVLKNFLKKQNPFSRPLLLALSGGPDSLALYHALLELGASFSVAHVDHGWRKESSEEASLIREKVFQDGITFHLKVLENVTKSENEARNERLRFFNQLSRENEYVALMLGHQRDDQVETLLKRLFEGAPLEKLMGMQEISNYEGLNLWRPLLHIPKKEIIQFLKERKISSFDDSTNRDPAFLRSRMRLDLIPNLENVFGKKIESSLIRFCSEFGEAIDWIKKQAKPLVEVEGPWGTYVDLSAFSHPFIIKFLVRKWLDTKGVSLSFESYETLVHHLLVGSANKWIEDKLYIDRKLLFILEEVPELKTLKIPLDKKIVSCGIWKLKITPTQTFHRPTNWRDLWLGKGEVVLPQGDYVIENYVSEVLDKRFTKAKVPALFRRMAPIISTKSKVVHEFLSGKHSEQPNFGDSKNWLKLEILASNVI